MYRLYDVLLLCIPAKIRQRNAEKKNYLYDRFFLVRYFSHIQLITLFLSLYSTQSSVIFVLLIILQMIFLPI